MKFIWSIISKEFFYVFFNPLVEGIIWFATALLVAFIVFQLKEFDFELNKQRKTFLLILCTLTPLSSMFLGIEILQMQSFPIPYTPIISKNIIMLLLYLPLFAASIYLGPKFASLLAFISGTLFGLLITHNPFTVWIVVFTTLGFLFLTRQNYNVFLYRYLREPFITCLSLILIFPVFEGINLLTVTSGKLAIRLEFVFSHLVANWSLYAIGLLIPALVAQIVKSFLPHYWVLPREYRNTKPNSSILRNVYLTIIPLMLIFFSMIIFIDWNIARNQKVQQFSSELQVKAQNIEQILPSMLETGQVLIQNYAQSEQLLFDDNNQIQSLFNQFLNQSNFFENIYLLNLNGEVITGFPDYEQHRYIPSIQEENAIRLAFNGVSFQLYPVSPIGTSKIGQLSFITPIFDSNQEVYRILVGRMSLIENSYAKSLLQNINDIEKINGTVLLLTPQNQILYQTQSLESINFFRIQDKIPEGFSEQINNLGIHQLFYLNTSPTKNWQILAKANAYQTKLIDYSSYTMRLAMIALTFFFLFILVRNIVKDTIFSLEKITQKTSKIHNDSNSNKNQMSGTDEISRLANQIELMRETYLQKLQEKEYMLELSNFESFDIENQKFRTYLFNGLLQFGAETARIVLYPQPTKIDFQNDLEVISEGKLSFQSELIDTEMISFLTDKQLQVIDQKENFRHLFTNTTYLPEKIILIKLNHKNKEFGFIWLTHFHSHQLTKQEKTFYLDLSQMLSELIYKYSKNNPIDIELKLKSYQQNQDAQFFVDQLGNVLHPNHKATQLFNLTSQKQLTIDSVRAIAENKRFYYLFRGNPNQSDQYELYWQEKILLVNVKRLYLSQEDYYWFCLVKDLTEYRISGYQKESIYQFIYNDFRHSLNSISDNLLILNQAKNLQNNQLVWIRKIADQTHHMQKQIENLLSENRLSQETFLSKQSVDLTELINKIIKRLQTQIAQKAIEIKEEQISQTIFVDPDLFEIALYNLIENAIKYSSHGGMVFIKSQNKSNCILIIIEDQGIGIAPIDIDKIMQPYYQVNKQQESNLGLGLSITKTIVKKHQGKLTCESKLGYGSQFTIQIPKKN